MDLTYTTSQGQTWDEIALEVYGDEVYAGYLMENNFEQLDILIFSSGTILYTPELEEEYESETPPWVDPDEDEDDWGDSDDPYD